MRVTDIVVIAGLSIMLASCQSSKKEKDVPVKVTGNVQKQVAIAAKKYGVPVPLALAVSKHESGNRCDVRGAAGEIGPLQIKPSTAAGLGYNGGLAGLKKSCAEQIKWGVMHLASAYKRGGSVWKAAYLHNAGLYVKSFNHAGAKRYANIVAGKL